MSGEILRKKFLEFFKEKGHAIVPSSSLIPDDPSVLLTTAGMQQFKVYYTGKADPHNDFGSKNVVSIQKCFRTSDIDEVGDESHLTFFEMLGNFSFGGYFKKETIQWGYEFLTRSVQIAPDRITATYFMGDSEVPQDSDSFSELKKILPHEKIKAHGRGDNFWGPTGGEGPCGPTVEFYVDGIEIWNLVFNEYYKHVDARLDKLKTPGVDTGMGLERLAMVTQGVPTIFETDLFKPCIDLLERNISNVDEKIITLDSVKRVIVDHARAIVFLVSDGVLPSNKDAGYILRRLMRRYIFRMYSIGGYHELLNCIIDSYSGFYPELDDKKVLAVFGAELSKFEKTLTLGLGELYKMKSVDVVSAFRLFQSYGLPYEVIKDYAGEKAKSLHREAFDAEFKKHQEISRAGQEKKFGGHGLILSTGELKAGDEEELKKVLQLHTATHLLQQALRDVLGREVQQQGSDITAERTRFDFLFPRKVTREELDATEAIVNQKIKENLPVQFKEMSKEEAEKTGALFFFKEKYPPIVKVYYVGFSIDTAYSKEFCGGPHVARTGEIGTFKIIKEESVGSGTRRIRGVVI